MTRTPLRSRLLLLPEARPASAKGERPKVRRYSLARLPVGPTAATPGGGLEHHKPAGS